MATLDPHSLVENAGLLAEACWGIADDGHSFLAQSRRIESMLNAVLDRAGVDTSPRHYAAFEVAQIADGIADVALLLKTFPDGATSGPVLEIRRKAERTLKRLVRDLELWGAVLLTPIDHWRAYPEPPSPPPRPQRRTHRRRKHG